MLTITPQDNAETLISGFPPQAMSVEDIGIAWGEISTAVAGGAKKINFDLSGVTADNHGFLALFASFSEYCKEHRIQLVYVNAETGLQQNITRILKSTGSERMRRISLFEHAGEAFLKFLQDIKGFISFIGELGQACFFYLKHPNKIPFREILFCVEKTGADAAFISGMLCFLSGLILGFQALVQLQRFGLEVYMADMVSLALIQELGPLMVAMICTGRAGSAFAAEIGTMKVNEEIDAMTTMGLVPIRQLAFPKIVGLAIAMPLLTALGDILGTIGGMVVALSGTSISIIEYINRIMNAMTGVAVVESMLKAFTYALIISVVGCLRGFEAKKSAEGVGEASTSSIVTAIFLVVVADAIITYSLPVLLKLVI